MFHVKQWLRRWLGIDELRDRLDDKVAEIHKLAMKDKGFLGERIDKLKKQIADAETAIHNAAALDQSANNARYAELAKEIERLREKQQAKPDVEQKAPRIVSHSTFAKIRQQAQKQANPNR